MAEENTGYHSDILHDPVDYDPNGPVAKVISLLEKTLRVEFKDKRVVVGIFTAFDKFGNMVLTECKETFEGQPERSLPMVIVPLDYMESVSQVLNPEPAEKPDAQ